MITLFAGSDGYTSYQAAKKEAADIASRTGKSVLVLDGDELRTPGELLKHFEGVPMFGGGEVILLKRAFTNPVLGKYLEKHLAEVQGYDLVLWEEGKINTRSALVKQIQKCGKVTSHEEEKPRAVEKWLQTQAKEKEIGLDKTEAAWLVEHVGTDKWQLMTELEKLSFYLAATGAKLDIDILEKVVGLDVAGDIWRFLEALTAGNKSTALDELNKLTQYEDNIQYLISMLARELSILSQVKYAQEQRLGTDLGLHPFVLQKARSKIAKFSWPLLQKLSQALLRLDVAIKEGRIEDEVGLMLYVLSW